MEKERRRVALPSERVGGAFTYDGSLVVSGCGTKIQTRRKKLASSEGIYFSRHKLMDTSTIIPKENSSIMKNQPARFFPSSPEELIEK